MSTFAAVMTGKGTGAISTIAVFGDGAEAVVGEMFQPAGRGQAVFKSGKILLGTIVDDSETVDQVTIGCEGRATIAINCHGNPLIVEMIMQLLQQHGVELITAEELLAKTVAVDKNLSTIAREAKLVQARAQTVEGTKLIANQIDGGLSRKATQWLEQINKMSLDKIKGQAGRILDNSRKAKLIMYGCTAVITGPPNSGKSTLLNQLCGRQKAIVTDIKGTTRDWVSGRCKIGPLSVELIDTAGLDEKPAATVEDYIEKASRQKTVEVLENADLVLLVLDNSQPTEQVDDRLLEKTSGKNILTVLNKSDLPTKFDTSGLPELLRDTVLISAKLGTGIEKLVEKIPQICGVAEFDLKAAVCTTGRQEDLLKQLQEAKSKQQAAAIITELLNGQLSV